MVQLELELELYHSCPLQCDTTYMGRKSIVEVSQYLKELGGRVVYGDTDSNYVTLTM